MDILDILAAIKVDAIVALALAEPNEAFEMHRRLKRLSDTIDVAISEFKALAGIPAPSAKSIANALGSEAKAADPR